MIHASLNHVALDVADRRRSVEFYRDLFGAEVVADDDQHRFTFLRLPGSERYADLALHEHPQFDAAYPPGPIRLAHTGWEIQAETDLVRAHDFFTERTNVVLAADFGVARSVMGLDPDGHVVELQLFPVGTVDVHPGFEMLDIDALRSTVTA